MLMEHNHSINEFKRITTISDFALMMQLLPHMNGITFAYKAVLESVDTICDFQIQGLETTREFNYVFLNNPFSLEAVNYFDSFR